MEEADYEGFSIRDFTRNVRSVDIRKCCPFSGDFTGDFIHSLLPPLTVAKFRWWSHELTKSPDDPKPAFRGKANAESRPCKKRSIGETTTNGLVLHNKKIKSKKLDDPFDAKTDNKVYNCQGQARERAEVDGKGRLGIEERSGVMSPSLNKAGVRCLSYTEEEELVSQEWDSEFQIHGPLKVAKRKDRPLRSLDKSSIDASQCERQVRFSLHLYCSQMNQLTLSSSYDQSPKVMSNDQASDKIQHVVSERRLSFARAQSGFSCFPGPHLTLERIKDALDLERKRRLAQSIQSSISNMSGSHYRSCSPSLSQPALLNQSPFEPLLVEEAISRFPLNLQGEVVKANGSSRSAAAENDVLLSNFVDLSSGRKHSTEPALVPVYNEKQYKYYPARLGLDETFTENVSDANDGVCGQAVHALPEQDALNQNLSSRNMVTNRDGLCLHNTQSTMRLMGKDVSVKTGYSDVVRRGERIIDYSFLESYAQQSWLWRTTTTLGENYSFTSLDKSWNRDLLCDTSKDTTPFPMFCEPPPQVRTYVVPDSELPHTLLYPCGSSLMSCPLADNDLYFHESGLGQQLNSVTFSQQQLPFPSDPKIAGLPSYYRNVGVGCLLPDARELSFGLPFTSTRQCSFESSRLDMSSFNPTEPN